MSRFALGNYILATVSLVSSAMLPNLHGQETAVGADAGTSARAQFDAQFTAYKEQVRKIEALRGRFQLAGDEERAEINAGLDTLIAQTQAVMDRLITLGVAAYQQTPGDQELESFLTAVAKHYLVGQSLEKSGGNHNGGDQYELALPVIQALIDGGAKNKELPVWGVVAAFVTQNYDLAERYYQLAQETQALADPKSLKDEASGRAMGLALQYGEQIDRYRDLWAAEQKIREAEAAAGDLPQVKLTTTQGDIVLELFENEAPEAVANFITLIKQGYYTNVPFHRVLPGFMVQGGDPTGTGSGGPGYSIRCECDGPNIRHHFRGSLSMAHAGPDTGGSQFFLTAVPTGFLDGRHTVFGRVSEGIDVLGELQRIDPNAAGQPPTPDKILSAEVLRDRGHAYSFEKLPGR